MSSNGESLREPGSGKSPDVITRLAIDSEGRIVVVTEYPDGSRTNEVTTKLDTVSRMVRDMQTLHLLEHGTGDDTSSVHDLGDGPNLDIIREQMGYPKPFDDDIL